MKEYRECINEIRRGKNLEQNLPRFALMAAEEYGRVAWVDMALQGVLFYQSLVDETDTELKGILERVGVVLRENVLGSFSGQAEERSVAELDELRNGVSRRMEVLTAYVDQLEVYEYVLNRLNVGFGGEVPETDVEQTARELYAFIFSPEDLVSQNQRLRQAIGQLPLRMARQKFYDLLRQSFNRYCGSGRPSVELYDYMLRTSSMLYRPEGIEEYYKKIQERMECFQVMDYEALTEAEYQEARQHFEELALDLEFLSEECVELQKVINNLYVLILTKPYAGMEEAGMYLDNAQEAAERVVRSTVDAFEGKFASEEAFLEEIDEDLCALEGKLEGSLERLADMEVALEEIKEQHGSLIESLMLRPLYDSLHRCTILRSDSTFADLDMKKEEELVTEELLSRMAEELIEDFAESFAGKSRLLRRAVMAAALNKMPPFLNSKEEIYNYFRSSLGNCTNPAELAGSVNVLKELMEQWGFLDELDVWEE